MPEAFNKCAKGGGRVRTMKPSKNTHQKICFDKNGSHPGHVQRNKSG